MYEFRDMFQSTKFLGGSTYCPIYSSSFCRLSVDRLSFGNFVFDKIGVHPCALSLASSIKTSYYPFMKLNAPLTTWSHACTQIIAGCQRTRGDDNAVSLFGIFGFYGKLLIDWSPPDHCPVKMLGSSD